MGNITANGSRALRRVLLFAKLADVRSADNHSDIIWKGIIKNKQELEKVVLGNLK